MILDAGPQTVGLIAEAFEHARTVIWNGPMGVFEWKDASAGTFAMAKALAEAVGFTVVGGGGDQVVGSGGGGALGDAAIELGQVVVGAVGRRELGRVGLEHGADLHLETGGASCPGENSFTVSERGECYRVHGREGMKGVALVAGAGMLVAAQAVVLVGLTHRQHGLHRTVLGDGGPGDRIALAIDTG